MTFHSILFEDPDVNTSVLAVEPPVFFHDLNLDRIIDAITAEWIDYNLKPFYYTRPNDLRQITYRQEIMRDLEDKTLMNGMNSFSEQMRTMRVRVSQADEAKRMEYKYATQRAFLGAVEIYCGAVECLSEAVSAAEVKSRGMVALRSYLASYIASEPFRTLAAEARKAKASLATVRYCLLLRDGSVTVRHYEAEDDYSTAVEETFETFRRDATLHYRFGNRKWEGMNHIEAQVQERVALLFPDIFRALDVFCTARAEYVDAQITRFDREIQFYVAYLTYVDKFRRAGLSFCLPHVSQTSREIHGRDAFDLALADKLFRERNAVVPNDYFLNGSERIFVVTGPNQGGKTTFARMIGQLHYLGSLGCLVPGNDCQLFMFDHLYTHFEREEDITNLHGKLKDDLIRIRQILDRATPRSLIIMNEMFSSTTLKDARYLSRMVMEAISELDLLGVWVTFLDELSSLNEKTVSVVGTVSPDNPAVRTYRLERRPANGLAHALAIAQKYRVTYDWLRERVKE